MGHNLTDIEAKRLLVKLFEDRAKWERSKLFSEVERLHRQGGGIITAQSPNTAVKRALKELKTEGLIANIGKGLWAKAIEVSDKATAPEVSLAQSVGIPLQPVYARTPILKLLAERDKWQRAELAKRLEADHLAAGHELGTQDALTVTKKALT